MMEELAEEAADETRRCHTLLFGYLLKPLHQSGLQQKTDLYDDAALRETTVDERSLLPIDDRYHLRLL
jgi:hypothetical protein